MSPDVISQGNNLLKILNLLLQGGVVQAETQELISLRLGKSVKSATPGVIPLDFLVFDVLKVFCEVESTQGVVYELVLQTDAGNKQDEGPATQGVFQEEGQLGVPIALDAGTSFGTLSKIRHDLSEN